MTNYEHIKQMSAEEIALFLLEVNSAYDVPCMWGMSDCKHANIKNKCVICFKEWLESEVDENN